MAALWEEEQKLKEIMERRRMEGSSLQLDAMQRVQELLLNERMLQGERVKSLKEKKKIPRWRRVRKNKNIKTRKCGEDYFFLVQRIQLAAFAKQTGGVNRRRGDEAAAKNDDYERSDKEK